MKVKVILIALVITAIPLILFMSNNRLQKTSTPFFAIYLVDSLSIEEALNEDIEKIPLKENAIISIDNLSKYQWETHEFQLIDSINIGEIPLTGEPFVLVADGERIYVGSFWNKLSSAIAPDVTIINVPGDSINKYKIEYKHNEQKDIRNDMRIYNGLKKASKLQ